MSVENLISFWKESIAPDQNGNYVHPKDEEVLQAWLRSARALQPRSVSSMGVSLNGKQPPRTGQLHLGIPPMPYVGNLRSAKIILGMINPTVSALDYADNDCGDFKQLREDSLRQNTSRCFALDPNTSAKATSWSEYYRGLFKGFLEEYAAGSSRKAVEERFASETAVLELVPYYSQNATMLTQGELTRNLESAQCALAAMKEIADRPDTLIICRWESGMRRWGLTPAVCKATVICSKSRRGLSKDAKNALAAHLKLSS